MNHNIKTDIRRRNETIWITFTWLKIGLTGEMLRKYGEGN